MSGPWDFDPSYIFPDYQDEQRYEQPTEATISKDVWCVACNVKIGGLELHVLKTLNYGWHVNSECLKNMEEWIIDEFKRRMSKQWTGK